LGFVALLDSCQLAVLMTTALLLLLLLLAFTGHCYSWKEGPG
jgi:hypothetical protein